jgi:glycosyltransferase involved in cell wall biosynthesis
MTTPILSLAIPTFNRPEFLDKLLMSVADELQSNPSLKANIELVVSDNASEPSTLETVRRWKALIPNIISYRCNSTNLGGPANLVAAIESARGTYVMYIGDDDRLRAGSLSSICHFIREQGMPPVCIFADSQFLGADAYALGPMHEARINLDEALRSYFFCAGIPGGAAIRCDFVRASLGHTRYEELFRTNWPQTVIAFLAAFESGEDFPIAVRHEMIAYVSEHHNSNTIYTARILLNTWVYGLVEASQILETLTGRLFLSAACEDIFTSRRLRMYFERTVDHILLIDTSDEVAILTIELESRIEKLPWEYRSLQHELLSISRTPPLLRSLKIVLRKLFSPPLIALLQPRIIFSRIKSLWTLICYRSRHRLMVRNYKMGIGKNVRDYSQEGY